MHQKNNVQKNKRRPSSGGAKPLPAKLRKSLTAEVKRARSVNAAAKALKVSVSTLRRAHLGESLRAGTHALISKALGGSK